MKKGQSYRKANLEALRKEAGAPIDATVREVVAALYRRGNCYKAARLLLGAKNDGVLSDPLAKKLFGLVAKRDLSENLVSVIADTAFAEAPAGKFYIRVSSDEYLNFEGSLADLICLNLESEEADPGSLSSMSMAVA